MTGSSHPEHLAPMPDVVAADGANAGRPAPWSPEAGAHAAPVALRNAVLRALSPGDHAALLPHLEPCTVDALEVLAHAERPLAHAYFPESALVAVFRRTRDGTPIEAFVVGREGMVGLSQLLGDPGSPATVIAGEVPGACSRIALGTLRALLPELPTFERQLRRRLLALLDEVQQAVACNGLHTLQERCARLLLRMHDRVGRDEFLLTHEMLAQLLAVRRSGVTVAAGVLQRAGVIAYSRGRLRIVDRAGLEAAACECYAVVRAHSARLLSESGEPVS
ncbi:MAG: Crp/Fnr family transcriptional regulator [Gemmatirosa sp.]